MSFSVSVDPSARRVRLDYTGSPNFEEWVAAVESALADSGYRPGFSWLIDRRDSVVPDTRFVRSAARFLGRRAAQFAGSRIAIVVDSEAGYGMSRMHQILTEESLPQLEIFADIAEAERWLLGAPPGEGARWRSR
jgi:hypothetical protein